VAQLEGNGAEFSEEVLEERLRFELSRVEPVAAVRNTLNWWRGEFRFFNGRPPTWEQRATVQNFLKNLADEISPDLV
jgi:hypothetical protein